MKKILFAFIAMIAMVASCQKTEEFSEQIDAHVLHASIEKDKASKTILDENNNVRWTEGDQIVAFMKTSLGLKYQLKDTYIGETSGYFSKVSSGSSDDLGAGMEWDHIVAYYPYAESIKCAKIGDNYAIDVVLPTEQTYQADSFGNGSWPMVAVSKDNDITFKNVCGGMKLLLKGTQKVTSIKIQGKNNEKLAGSATVITYTGDNTKPAITMASGASTSVTLNCGAGVQLNESTATEFIIALPPVLFSKGFTVTVTDAADKTYTVDTNKANTVLRSSLVKMPSVLLDDSIGGESGGEDDELIIPVSYINLNSTFLKLYVGYCAHLTATIGPNDATDKVVVWSSNTPSVAVVDQEGLVTGVSPGTAMISAVVGGKIATCEVAISALTFIDYIDEYKENQGKGILVGMTVWAPVNCGYHKVDYKYGKLYQWGRKYGQGYDEDDALVPSFTEGGVSEIGGNHNSNSNVFYIGFEDWLDTPNDNIWNSGTESKPVKTESDPCPSGWRIPTYSELNELSQNHSSWTANDKGYLGYWLSGRNSYVDDVPQVFFPAAGFRYIGGNASGRGKYGFYWSSRPYKSKSYILGFNNSVINRDEADYRTRGSSIRCVQE